MRHVTPVRGFEVQKLSSPGGGLPPRLASDEETQRETNRRSRPPFGGWSDPVWIADSLMPNPIRMARAPDGTLWVVWRDDNGSGIFYRYSTDGGQSWRTGEDGGVVASERGNMFRPDVSVGQDNLAHVVWYVRGRGPRQGDVRYADWNGTRFSVGDITTDGSDLYDADPAITVDGQNIQHVVWRKLVAAGRWDIIYADRPPGAGWQT